MSGVESNFHPSRANATCWDTTSVSKQQFDAVAGDDAESTRPYFSRKDPYRDNFVSRSTRRNMPNLPYAPPEIVGTATYRVGGVRFNYTQPARMPRGNSLSDRSARSVWRSIRRREWFRCRGVPSSVEVRAEVLSNVEGPADVKAAPGIARRMDRVASRCRASLHARGRNPDCRIPFDCPQIAAHAYTVAAVAEYARQDRIAKATSRSRIAIWKRGSLYHPAVAAIQGVEVRVASNLKVAYVMGAGDAVPEALAQIGIKPQLLAADDLERRISRRSTRS